MEFKLFRKTNTNYARSSINLSYIRKYVGIIFIFDLLLWWRYMVLYNFMQVSFNKKVSRPKWTLSYPHQPTCMCIYIYEVSILNLYTMYLLRYSFYCNCTQCSNLAVVERHSFTGITWTHKIHEPWVECKTLNELPHHHNFT